MVEERRRSELEDAVTAFRAATPAERMAMNAAVTRAEAAQLDGIAQEAAERAVREEDPERIHFGLAALAYEPVKERAYFSNAGARIIYSYAAGPSA